MTAEELSRILDELGQRLGPAGEYAFSIAVRYQLTSSLIWGIGSALVLALTVGITVWTLRLGIRRWGVEQARFKEKGYGSQPDLMDYGSQPDLMDYVMPGILGGLVLVLVIICFGIWFLSSLVTILNPEYAALRDLIRVIK